MESTDLIYTAPTFIDLSILGKFHSFNILFTTSVPFFIWAFNLDEFQITIYSDRNTTNYTKHLNKEGKYHLEHLPFGTQIPSSFKIALRHFSSITFMLCY